MTATYPQILGPNDRFRYCPMCRAELGDSSDADGFARPKCPACGWTHYFKNLIGAIVVVEAEGGLVFIFPPDEPDGAAALPAGLTELGETPEETAIREVREETGLEIELVRQLGNYVLVPDTPFGPILNFVYLARATGGAVRQGYWEGRVEIRPLDDLPPISAKRKGSQAALARYLAQAAVTGPFKITRT